ncbi:MAG: hypothetical protein JO000_12810 [Alphaproteobacteria bacterium]|nr:hypothetical protein [Alphaproteobacteria bacterium]
MAAFAAALAAALLPSAAVAQNHDADLDGDDPMVFVRRVYQREILRDVRGGRLSSAAPYALFTAEVRRVLQSPVQPRPNFPIGLSHAFYGPGVLPGTEVTLQNVTPAAPGQGGTAVAVDLQVRGTPRRIIVRVAREKGRWRIADIDYGTGESYMSYQRKVRGQ